VRNQFPHQSTPIGQLPESLSLGHLTGVKALRTEHVELVHGSQLRAADRLLSLYSVLVTISVFLVGLRLHEHTPIWQLVLWAFAVAAVHVPLVRMRRANRDSDYAAVKRTTLLRHGGLALLQGAVWVTAMLLFTRGAEPAEVANLWTIACCLMASFAICFQSTPLSATSFIVSLGSGAVLMMLRHTDPWLAAVVATYASLAVGAALWQAHLFGVQLTTSKMLAEKEEVVSLLLREHDDATADALWRVDGARRLAGVSAPFARMLGKTVDEIEGRSILEVLAGTDWTSGPLDPALHLLAEKFKLRVSFSDLILPITLDGKRRWLSISASPRLDEKGVFIGYRGVGSDVTVEKETNERIAQLAHFDTLTGLPNRLRLSDELARAVDAMKLWKTHCSFLMIDLDRFKSVNDTLGHMVGDQLLAQVADRLRNVCKDNEVCGRLGGDEFAVLVRDVSDPIQIDYLAAAIIEAVSKPYVVDGQTLFIGASVGSAMAPHDGDDADALMRSADLAMYRAKEAGRGKHLRFAPSMHADAEERRHLELALRTALGTGQFYLMYQPIVNARTRVVTGFEALCRWTHPELGPIPPTRFIPIAEDARLISDLGYWVLKTACKAAKDWPEEVSLSVNISAEQLCDPEIAEQIAEALSEADLPAHRLELEVTESVFIREGTGATKALERLTQLGVRLSLDDFGTGYSSLGYLSRTRFNTIKIDRSFVTGAARSQRESLAIVNAVVALAQSLGMDTTAEGVETEGEYDIIRALGCSKIQGYYFGRPMTGEDAVSLFDRDDIRVA
jgi:diguanylate cyclase (GGDEF)-like protein/PAS domain S-box-containing protein